MEDRRAGLSNAPEGHLRERAEAMASAKADGAVGCIPPYGRAEAVKGRQVGNLPRGEGFCSGIGVGGQVDVEHAALPGHGGPLQILSQAASTLPRNSS